MHKKGVNGISLLEKVPKSDHSAKRYLPEPLECPRGQEAKYVGSKINVGSYSPVSNNLAM